MHAPRDPGVRMHVNHPGITLALQVANDCPPPDRDFARRPDAVIRLS